MILITKKSSFFLSIFGFLFLLNISLVFKIPLILQASGIVALCIVPGYLLSLLSRIQVSDLYENFFYWVGLSVIFDLLFGVGINTLFLVLGNTSPLSQPNLQLSYSVVILGMTSLICSADRAPLIAFHDPNLSRIEKVFLIIGSLLVVLFETGIFLINVGMTNLVLIFSILMVPVILFLCIIYHNNSLKRIYPFLIFLISISLLMLLAIRSNFILGVDINEEYYFFLTTLTKSIWFADPDFLLSSALSISILPTLFENFLSINPQLLFKLLFAILFSITPVIIYTIVKKYFNELLALLAACFFMFQRNFIDAPSDARTSVAVVFFALTFMVLCDREMKNTKKYTLLLLFIIGMIISHYTTSFIFLLIITLTYLIALVLGRIKMPGENSFVNLPLIIFSMSLIYFWYQQIINIVFSSGLRFTIFRSNIFNDFLQNDLGQYKSSSSIYIHPPTILVKLVNYSRLALYAFIGLGIIFALYCWIRKFPRDLPLRLSSRISGILIFMGCIAIVLLFLSLFAPYLFYGYDTGRTSEILFIILPIFLISGICVLVTLPVWENIMPGSKNFLHPAKEFLRLHRSPIAAVILLFLLVPQLLFATYVTDQFDGGPYSIILNSPKFSIENNLGYDDQYSYSYIYDQDAASLQWFKEHSNKDSKIIADSYGNKKITTIIGRPSYLYQPSVLSLQESDLSDMYIFLTTSDEYTSSIPNSTRIERTMNDLGLVFSEKNKIFANSAVIYR
jgi:uncharacterized membrane protein